MLKAFKSYRLTDRQTRPTLYNHAVSQVVEKDRGKTGDLPTIV